MAHRFQLVECLNMEGRLEHVRVPTLVLAGERDVLVSEGSLRMLRAGIPQAQVVRLAGCGHLASVTQPARVADETRRFLLGRS
jgi:pimeloyl-ACP methyl ester carboxylesterase